MLLLLPAFDNSLGGLDGEVTVLEAPEFGTAKDDRKFIEFCHASLICRRLRPPEAWGGPAEGPALLMGGLLLILQQPSLKKKHRQTLDNIIICRKWFSNMMTSIGGRVLGPAQWYILGEIGTQML